MHDRALACRCGFAIVLAGALLAGCTPTMGYPGSDQRYASSQTADERLLREQSDSFVQDNVFGGAATGALVGCMLGALAGALIAHDAKSAAIGCGAGGAG